MSCCHSTLALLFDVRALIATLQEDIHGAYVLNLVVDVAVRGKGVGLALMAAAAQQAVGHWEAKMIYTHVDSQNEVIINMCNVISYFVRTHVARYYIAEVSVHWCRVHVIFTDAAVTNCATAMTGHLLLVR